MHGPAELLSIAPMIQWTDRYFRFLMRQLTSHTLLYTEMTMDNALLHNRDALDPFIGHEALEHPLALQLGGNDASSLGEAAYLCEAFGAFEEINLNCGCPSNKARRGGFGAELMLDPPATRMLVHEMCRRVTHTEVSVKCRIGVTGRESRDDLVDFIRAVTEAGARKVVLHARTCVLRGLSPAQNRSVPPLNYERAAEMAALFPEVRFVLNGGVQSLAEARSLLDEGAFSGVMVGRAAYHSPCMFASADRLFYGDAGCKGTRRDVLHTYLDFAERMHDKAVFGSGVPNLCKPLHNFFNDGSVHAVRAYKHKLDALLKSGDKRAMSLEDTILDAIDGTIPACFLDAPLGDRDA